MPQQCLVATSRRAECLIARRLGEPHRRLRPCIDHGRDPLGLGCGRASGCLTTVGAAVASIRVDALRCLKLTRGMAARPPAPAAFRSSSWLRGRAPFASPLVHELRYGGDECRRGDTECYAAIELCGLSLTVQRRASRFRIERRVQDRAGGVPGVRLPYPEGTREMVGRRPAQVGEVAPRVELRGHGDEGWPAP